MIKNYTLTPFKGANPLPRYIEGIKEYTLIGVIENSYEIVLAKLTVGKSKNDLVHALFESFDDHGRRMATARTRAGGFDREFTAVKNAMRYVGIEFGDVTLCSSESLIKSLGAWFCKHNPEIKSCYVMSQISP